MYVSRATWVKQSKVGWIKRSESTASIKMLLVDSAQKPAP